MAGDVIEKSKLMAYVHGELEDKEARRITEILQHNDRLRAEVEELKRIHQGLAPAFAAPPAEGLSPAHSEKLRIALRPQGAPRRLMVGGAVVGVGLLALSLIFSQGEGPSAPPEPDVAVPERSVDQAPCPTVDAEPQTAVAPPAVAPADTEAASQTLAAELSGAATPSASPSSQEKASILNEQPTPPAKPTLDTPPPAKTLKVTAIKVPAGVSKDKVTRLLRQKWVGDSDCVPQDVPTIKGTEALITINKVGSVTAVKILPKNAAYGPLMAKCLKKKLGNKTQALKPSKPVKDPIRVGLGSE